MNSVAEKEVSKGRAYIKWLLRTKASIGINQNNFVNHDFLWFISMCRFVTQDI